jgi:hypothetical protein
VLRPRGPVCDIGAFERGPVPAALDFDGDGTPDLVVAAGRGSDARVRVLAGAGLTERLSFLAYDPPFRGGVQVAVCDLTADGVPDIVTAPGAGPPLIRVFDGTSGLPLALPLGGFLAFPEGPRALGATVGCADVSGDGVPDILVGAGPGGGGHVKIFSGVDALPGFAGGVSVGP